MHAYPRKSIQYQNREWLNTGRGLSEAEHQINKPDDHIQPTKIRMALWDAKKPQKPLKNGA
jgi:hypothetical protein